MACFRLDLVAGTVSGILELISGSLLGYVVGGYLWLRSFGVPLASPVAAGASFVNVTGRCVVNGI